MTDGLRDMTGCRLFAALLAAAVLLGAAEARALDRVVLQLRWDHQFQFAGFYAAKWQGYYEEAGLDVEIRSAVTPDRSILKPIDEVVEGRAEFGISGADLLIARDNGADVVIAAVVMQQSPVAVMAKAGTPLSSPADLAELRVGKQARDVTDVELRAMLRAEGIDPDTLNWVDAYTDGKRPMGNLLDDRFDAYAGFTLSAIWMARQRGLEIATLRPSAYGVDFYGDSLFTTARLVDRDPGLVERFVEASRAGWRYALANPEEIADRISNELTRTFPLADLPAYNLFLAQQMRRLMLYPIVQPGHTNPGRWRRMHGFLMEGGLVSRPFDADGAIFDPRRIRVLETERLRLALYAVSAGVLALGALAGAWVVLSRRRLAAEALREANAQLEDRVEERTMALSREVERRRRLTEELARSNQELEQFAYVASHDLQEPLRAVSSYADLLSKRYGDGLDERGRKYLRHCVDGSRRMAAMIDALLSFSRVTTRGGTFEPLAADDLLDQALSNLQTAIQESGATVVRGAMPTIVADGPQIMRLFQNLIGNAIKFRNEAAPEVTVTADRVDEAWEFSVRDNGIGIDPGFADRIFVIFQRLHGRDEYPGSGLGLAICKRIVERHGGTIRVASEPGGGADFRFTIPDRSAGNA